ncbi:tumor necrosis factor ligand superfamily member 10-like [Spea bombifrons]|uniref:tumor necrosis factor ligand superfamily member 10-like n=1 Tax=Spea bombifrons TaxID=233779 RepID=UPI00234926F0|nr:tumor necrosis factor ligand superfamily member 10-like [Spea bombifrons]
MSNKGTQQYYRTESSDSAASMLRAGREEGGTDTDTKGRERRECNPFWLPGAIGLILVLQIACTTGLFVYFSVSVSKIKVETQGMSEELRCLQIINTMGRVSDNVEFDPDEFSLKESCQKLVNSIKSYVTQVTESAMQRTKMIDNRMKNITYGLDTLPDSGFNIKTSAHLTLRTNSYSGEKTLENEKFRIPYQSCHFPVKQWDSNGPLSHVQNMIYRNGHLNILQDGKYYIYSQIYFRYPHNEESSTSSIIGHQLVQCINKKTSYVEPILLLKGIGTKCWSPDAEYGLHSIHHGGVFELRSGDELFVSVSSLNMVNADGASSFFGAFMLDM